MAEILKENQHSIKAVISENCTNEADFKHGVFTEHLAQCLPRLVGI